MECKVCGVKIQNTQYTGLGEFEEVCPTCAKPIIKARLPQIKEKYRELIREGK